MKTKLFIDLLQRLRKSKYKKFLMHNHMIMMCYSIDEDSDVGLHYILHIPDNEEYNDPFYDRTLILDPATIINVYNEGHTILLEKKKELNAKPKEIREEFYFDFSDKYGQFKFLFMVQDEIVCEKSHFIKYPVDEKDPIVISVLNTYSSMLDNIKIGGLGYTIDALTEGLYYFALNSSNIRFHRIILGSTKVRIPIYKSMFLGVKSFDEIFLSIQETNISDIYLYTIQMARKNIIEQFIGYIQNF